MTPATLLIVAFVVLLALFVLYYALRNWTFELSPFEWGLTVVLAASGGFFLCAYLLNDGWFELLSALPLIVVTSWFVIAAAVSAALGSHRHGSADLED